ncbi:VOC family protein [Halomonas sp. McH1-25]|nr:VOC family protein [Halomonas sp. BBD45]MCG7600786.1 VOC family protein [Halomonas sp. McH1-25]MCP1361056.1 VOC family protein [Halomonas sp. BBD45]MCP1366190.1 VOC family protein [Halomonas sp. BBD48]
MSLITLGVDDLARSRQFYETGLGWRVGQAVENEVVFFQLNGLILSLYHRNAMVKDIGISDNGDGFGGITLAYNARSREEADVVLSEAKQAGSRLVKPAQATTWGGYVGYFADPDGHIWEVAHNPYFPIDAEGRTTLGG